MRGLAAGGSGVEGGESSVASGTALTVLVAVAGLAVGEVGVETAATTVEARGHEGRGFGGLGFGVTGDDLKDWGKEATSSSILIVRVGSGRSGRVSGTFSSEKTSRVGTGGEEGFSVGSVLMVRLSRVGSSPVGASWTGRGGSLGGRGRSG